MESERSVERVMSYLRLFLPIALIIGGLIIALLGAWSLGTETTTRVTLVGNSQTFATAPGSPWGFIVVGGLVFVAGCTMQVLSWRTGTRDVGATRNAVVGGSNDEHQGRSESAASVGG